MNHLTTISNFNNTSKVCCWKVWLLFILILTSLPNMAIAQFDVSATIRLLPPYSVRLSDYADNPQNTIITIRNHTTRPISLYLAGAITGENGIVIRTTPNRRGSSMIQLDPLEIRNLNGEALRDLFDVNLLNISGISREAIVRGNGLPEGIYTICIRAYDYQTMEQLSAEEPMGCSNPINLTNLEPPFFLKPFTDNDTIQGIVPQNLIFTWSFPAGAPPTTEYTFTMIEMLDPRRNPNDAILSATTPPFFEETVNANAMLFGPAHPTLIPGRKYAIAVTAKDPFNKVVFRNNGRSEVLSFVYWDGTGNLLGDFPVSQPKTGQYSTSCQCKFTVPKGQTDNSRIQEGSVVKVGNFEMIVTKINSTGNKMSGEGKIQLDNLRSIPVSVSFTELQVNAQNQMKSGIITGMTKNTASLFPTSPSANLRTLEFSPELAQQVADYFLQNPQQLVSNILPGISQQGIEFPIGIEKTVMGQKHTIALNNLQITPEQASFDAAMVLELSGTGSKAIFSSRGICMDNSSFCGQTNLYLSNDLEVPVSRIKLLAAKSNLVSPLDSGTYVTMSASGFEKLRIQGIYEFPVHQVTNQNNPGTPVQARLFANTASWSDWMAEALIDPFHVNGQEDFTFSLRPGITAIYDHSSLRNPENMPQVAEKTNHLSPDWTGFYFPQLQVELPVAFKKINSTERIAVSASDMILDRMGISGNILANNVLNLAEGDLLGWYYSVEQIQASFINNSFGTSKMTGKLVLPISGSQYANPQAQLNYTCTMSKPVGAMRYQFQVAQKNNLPASLWEANLNILPSSTVEIQLGTESDFAKTNLHGALSIKGELDKLSAVILEGIPFEGLSLQSKAPFLAIDNFRTGLSGSIKSVGGFPVSLQAPRLIVNGTEAGIKLGLDLELGDIAALPKASCIIDLIGKIRNMPNGRPDWGWQAPDVRLSKIAVNGPVGPVSVKGEIEFFDKDNEYGNGLRGEVQAKMLGGLEISGNALFGRKGFSYWYVDARLQLPPPGITLAPPLPLSAFGFGGGAYYNMSQRPLPSPLQVFEGNFQKTNLYVPSPGLFGFKASIILGISDGQLYQAEGELEATLNSRTMAVNRIKIDVKTAMFAPLMKMENAVIQGNGLIQYDFANDIFDARADMKVGLLGIMQGSGNLAMHVNGTTKQWYMKMGDPFNPNQLTLLKFANFKSYYMAGSTELLPGMPPPPPHVAEKVGYSGSRPVYYSGEQRGLKLGFGANMQFSDTGPIDMTFLIFYAKIGAGIGFDVALEQFTKGCDGTSGLPGINGWYANGQLWAWMHGEAGLDLDMWLYKGRVHAFRVEAAALLSAGLPNPTWFEGWFGGGFSVLGGAYKGHMNFKVAFNTAEKCIPEKNPFDGEPLISQITPTGKGISTLSNPQVAFNFPIDKEIEINTVNKDGEVEPKKFRLVLTQFDLVNQKTNAVQFSLGNKTQLVIRDENYLATLFTTRTLDTFTPYNIRVGVKVEVWTASGYRDYQYNGKNVEQYDYKTIFVSGDCPKTLNEEGALLASYPFNRQRFLLQDEDRNGKLFLEKDLACLFGEDVYEVNATFRALSASNTKTDTVSVTFSHNGSQINFRIPQLPNDEIIEAKFFQKRKPKPTSQLESNTVSYKDRNIYVGALNQTALMYSAPNQKSNMEVRGIGPIGLSMTAKESEEIEIYKYYFKTSKFNTLTQKTTATSSGANAVKTASLGALEAYQVQIPADEGFDVYDVQGANYMNLAGMTFSIRPLISLTSNNRWEENYLRDYLYKSYGVVRASPYYTDINLALSRDLSLKGNGLPPIRPLGFSTNTAEPKISNSEISIKLLEMPSEELIKAFPSVLKLH